MVSAEQLAKRIKLEVTQCFLHGTIPHTVSSFVELHDYVDANCLGGTEALYDQIAASATTDAEHTAALDALCGVMNEAHAIVDRWLSTRGKTRVTRVRRRDGRF